MIFCSMVNPVADFYLLLGTVAPQEIRQYQGTTELATKKAHIYCLVKEISLSELIYDIA